MDRLTRISLVSLAVLMATAGIVLAEPPETERGTTRQMATGKEAKIAPQDAKTAAFLQKAVEEYVSSQISEEISEWRISNLNWTLNEQVPADFDNYLVIPQRVSKGGETLALAVQFTKNDQIIKRIGVNCKVDMFAEVVVAKGRIPRGAVITQDMVGIERMRMEQPPSELCTQIATIVGQVAERNILPGKVVLKSSLSRAADVKAGDLVVIVAETEGVKLTARGIAKKDGAIGEVIQVINVRSNKKLYAKVVDSGTVQVAF